MKKHRKQIPDYIPAHDAEILAKVRKWAYRLDVKMSFLGMRFGWATVIGSIPEVGDALDVILSIYVYYMCRKVDGGLDLKTKSKMKAWILTDGLIGTIPFVGDLIDVSAPPEAEPQLTIAGFHQMQGQKLPLARGIPRRQVQAKASYRARGAPAPGPQLRSSCARHRLRRSR